MRYLVYLKDNAQEEPEIVDRVETALTDEQAIVLDEFLRKIGKLKGDEEIAVVEAPEKSPK